MPTLDWIGKASVVNHHQEVPYRLLQCDKELSAGSSGEGNLLIQGDNLQALKSLLPYYSGQVKCITIDPPYNTGNEGWAYNDNTNDPEIVRWLGATVKGEVEDLSRHDKWLCMIYPRLVLLRELLSQDGAIFISLDENEIANLRLVMDEIFGRRNFVASIVWQKRTSPDARTIIGTAHDYIVVYAKSSECLRLNRIPLGEIRSRDYKNPDDDPRGEWASVDLTGQTGHATQSQYYEISTPSGKKLKPPAGRCWALAESTFLKLVEEDRIWFGKSKDARPRLKKYRSESLGTTTWTWWTNSEVGHNQEATKELNDILGKTAGFETPKPTRLIRRILQLATDPDSLVLDSFAGSGTTGHATLQLNKEDGGSRRFILVEMEPNIAQNVTAERLRRVVCGYGDTPGLGGGFRYCNLSEPLFNAQGQINETVSFSDLAHHIFFTETGEPLPQSPHANDPFIGTMNGVAYYLLWHGKDTETLLDNAALRKLPPHEGVRVIYADGCRVSPNRLKAAGVTFKQVPYEVRTN